MEVLKLASIRAASICAAFATVFNGFTTVSANTLEGMVIGISDGDTVTILVDRHALKVRVAGIDAPEKNQPYQPPGRISGRQSFEQMSIVTGAPWRN